MSEPLVTCLCLTKAGRGQFLRRAIGCYLDQSYENREMLIVPDQWQNIDDSYSPKWDAFGIEVLGLGCNVDRCIGSKRNQGCQAARGEIIAIWDDDDYSAPGRLKFQVQSLQVSRKAVTGFWVMKFTDGSFWWRFQAAAGFVIGSSLCFRKDWWDARHPNPKFSHVRPHNFPELQVGEDVGFCSFANEEGQLASCPDMDLMYATIHQDNTSVRQPDKDPGWLRL